MAMPAPVLKKNPVISGPYYQRLCQLAQLYEESVQYGEEPSERLLQAWREFVSGGGGGRDERRLHLQMSSGVTLIFTGQEAEDVMAELIKEEVIK